jgi:hypothetical protein
MKARHIPLIAACAAGMVMMLNGCTILGWTAGAMVDSALPKQEILPASEATAIGWNTPVKIIGTGGQIVAGQFDGFDRMSPADYATAYRRALSTLDTARFLPRPGDSLRVVTRLSQTRDGVFVSADTGGIRLLPSASQKTEDIPYRLIRELSGAQGVIHPDTLRRNIVMHRLPTSTALALQRHGKRELFPLDSVLQIQVPYQPRGSRIGLGIGLAVDIAVLTAIAVINSEHDRGHDHGYDDGFQAGRDDWYRDHPSGR